MPVAPEETVLTATLTEMPPPPVPQVSPVLSEPAVATKRSPPRRRVPTLTKPAVNEPAIETPQTIADTPPTQPDTVPSATTTTEANAAPAIESTTSLPPAVALPPRVELAYKVFLGTQGFLIGDATYRFEHDGDRYRIATVGQARGLAALIVRGTGKIESRGRITPDGLRPYEFAVERGSADKREVAFFDWDAGNVVLHDGGRAPLESPTFDPLTVLWQPYFSPPSRDDQTFSLATTRRVARYTLSLEGEETIAWPRGEVLTQRWHRRS